MPSVRMNDKARTSRQISRGRIGWCMRFIWSFYFHCWAEALPALHCPKYTKILLLENFIDITNARVWCVGRKLNSMKSYELSALRVNCQKSSQAQQSSWLCFYRVYVAVGKQNPSRKVEVFFWINRRVWLEKFSPAPELSIWDIRCKIDYTW